MPKIDFTAHEGGGWKPLPNGTYDIILDSCDQAVSRNGNPQLTIKGHVAGGASDGKKVAIWYVLKGGGWRVRQLLEATGIEFEEEDTGNVDDEGRPEKLYGFDTDDLPGCMVRFDVTVGEYEGKPKNNFNNPIAPPSAAKPAQAAAPKAAAAAQPAQAAAQPAAAPEGRRRVVRSGGTQTAS